MTEDSMDPAELRSTALQGLRWTVLARPATEIVALSSMLVLARLVSPAEFGRFAVAAIVSQVALIPSGGIGASLVQRATITREHLQAAFALALLIGLAFGAVVLVVISVLVVPVFGERTAFLARLCTIMCVVLGTNAVPSALLQRRLSFRRLGIVDVTTMTVQAVSSIIMAIAGLQAVALVLGTIFGQLATTVLMWIWAPSPPPRLRKGPVRDILGYGMSASAAALSWVGFNNCDYAIVGALRGPLLAGFYYRSYTLAVEYQKKVSLLMTTVGFPMLARTQNSEEMYALRQRMVRLVTLILFPLLVLLAIVAPTFVPWFLGARWAPAVGPTQILALGGAATLVINAAGSVLMASGRARALMGYGWGHFAVYASAVFVAAPYGLDAVAIAASAVHTAFLLVAYVLMLRGSGQRTLPTLWQDIKPATMSSLVLAAAAVPASAVLSAAHLGPPIYLAGVGVIAAPTYLLAMRTLFPESLQSLSSLAGHILPRVPFRAATRRLRLATARAER